SLASRSTVRKPRLCGVNWYSIPGLPRPTISFTLGSWLSDFGSVTSYQKQAKCSSRSVKFTTNQPTTDDRRLLLFFLLRLLRLLRSRFLAALFLGFLLALLDDLGFGWSSRSFGSHSLRGRRHFFLDGDHVSNRLVGIGEKLQLLTMRQVRNPQYLPKDQFGDIGFYLARNIGRQALDFDFARFFLKDCPLLFFTFRFALQSNGKPCQGLLGPRSA